MNPLDEWAAPGRARTRLLREWLKVVVLACAAGALTAMAARRADWSGVQRSRAELARAVAQETASRVVPAQASVTAALKPVLLADLLMQLTRMTEESGLHLRTLERRAAEKAAGVAAGRQDAPATAPRFHLVVSGDFLAMRRWLAGLPRLPALVVPLMLEVRRENGGGVLEADLQLFLDLPGETGAGPMETTGASPMHEHAPPDPFGAPETLATTETAPRHWQLAGLLQDAHHGLALFEQSGETRVLALPGGRARRIQLRGQVVP